VKRSLGGARVLYAVVDIELLPLDHACGPDCLCWSSQASGTVSETTSVPESANGQVFTLG
jgi:hypothetical protein